MLDTRIVTALGKGGDGCASSIDGPHARHLEQDEVSAGRSERIESGPEWHVNNRASTSPNSIVRSPSFNQEHVQQQARQRQVRVLGPG